MLKINKLLALNTISSLTLQITTILCGFIVPRLILQQYGSEVNGLVNSITQYLGIIAFLELGVGAVVQSSLYKPISDQDDAGISRIIVSADKFFRKLAVILLLYIGVLIVFYPVLVKSHFSWMYTAGLIIAISISSFAQYYFGVVDRLLLTASQRGYVQYFAQITTLVLNTIACVILIERDASIHIVKLTTSLIFLARPIYLRWYTDRVFNLNRGIKYEGEPIKQKWNGAAQHFASIALDATAMIVLTAFSTLSNVSIYSIYLLVVSGVLQLYVSLSRGIDPILGELWAKRDFKRLSSIFKYIEWLMHNSTVFFFGVTSLLIIQFVSIYTKDVKDVNYIQSTFAYLLVLAYFFRAVRLPYNSLILAAGHYKQTQNIYLIAAFINIIVSTISVIYFGLVGVTFGPLVAFTYQVFSMQRYCYNNLGFKEKNKFYKLLSVDILIALLAFFICNLVDSSTNNILEWIILSLKISTLWIFCISIANIIFFKKYIIDTMKKIISLLQRSIYNV